MLCTLFVKCIILLLKLSNRQFNQFLVWLSRKCEKAKPDMVHEPVHCKFRFHKLVTLVNCTWLYYIQIFNYENLLFANNYIRLLSCMKVNSINQKSYNTFTFTVNFQNIIQNNCMVLLAPVQIYLVDLLSNNDSMVSICFSS